MTDNDTYVFILIICNINGVTLNPGLHFVMKKSELITKMKNKKTQLR